MILSKIIRMDILFFFLPLVVVQMTNANEEDITFLENEEEQRATCNLWLAPSTTNKNLLGLYSGVSIEAGKIVGAPDIHIPIFDANENEPSQWIDMTWNNQLIVEDDILLQNKFRSRSFLPGVGTTSACSTQGYEGNIGFVKQGSSDDDLLVDGSNNDNNNNNDGTIIHRSQHPSAGSISYRGNTQFHALHDIHPGQELFLYNCYNDDQSEEFEYELPSSIVPMDMLESEAICIDNLSIQPSTIDSIGHGAFVKRNIKKGETITSSPVVIFDRSQTHIVEQYKNEKTGKIKYTEHVKQQQLLLNYCYGTKDSNILILPYAPGVNYINHAPTTTPANNQQQQQQANAVLTWSKSKWNDKSVLLDPATEVANQKKGEKGEFIVDYVALRDIEAGEEIFIDYGADWEEAWERHVKEWEPLEGSHTYVNAAEYKKQQSNSNNNEHLVFRTEEEQQVQPYPENILTACTFEEDPAIDYGGDEPVYWNEENNNCLRPCKILEREMIKNEYYYTVEVGQISNHFTPENCQLSHESQILLRTPEAAITFVDKEYTSDQFLQTAFRHEIGIPNDLYPKNWMAQDATPMGDFQSIDHLGVNQLEKVKWKKNGEVVTPNAYVMNLKPKIRESLLEYCDKLGITELYRDLTLRNNPQSHNEESVAVLQGLNWFVQRPPPEWRSNMHWISPMDANSQEDYLRALSAAGFDEVLQAIGKQLGMNGLACYHLSFIGVSHCTRGFVHPDTMDTGAKVYNVIIPLILANETGPELDLRSSEPENVDDEEREVGRLRYQYDVASLIGDAAMHGTSAVDYRVNKEMRMGATVYIADIHEGILESMLDDYSQHYPPADPELLMKMAGVHWKRDDPNAKLPEPFVEDFDTHSLAMYEISPLTWKRTQIPVSGYAHRIGLSPSLRRHLLEYCKKLGITGRFQSLLLEGSERTAQTRLTKGTMEDYNGLEWYVQPPPAYWESNMHSISPGNAKAHDDFLKQLSIGGFDDVLKSIGEYFQLDGLVAYHLSFMAVSHCVSGYVHHDFSGTQGKAFNIIIPLITVHGSGPELEVEDDYDQTGGYRYVYDEASIIGDEARYATGHVDYREQNKYSLAVSIYIADVNEDNADLILKDFTQVYPPKDQEGVQLLLSWAGRHWKSS